MIKGNNLKADSEKRHITYRGMKLKVTADFSLKTIYVRKQLSNVFEVLKKEANKQSSQPRILYKTKIPFKNEGKRNTFKDIQNLKNFLPRDLFYKKC